jgi:hypothetical protein
MYYGNSGTARKVTELPDKAYCMYQGIGEACFLINQGCSSTARISTY